MKKGIVSVLLNIVACVITLGISFWISPVLSMYLGDEAYGFIGLSKEFINYASIVTVALNSMAVRFITMALYKSQNEKVLEYYNSLLVADLVLALAIGLAGGIVVINIEHIFTIPAYLVPEVQIAFSISILNFILSMLFSISSVAVYVRNRMDLWAYASIISNIVKIIVLIALLIWVKPAVYFVAIGGIAYTLMYGIMHSGLTKKLMPDLKWKRKYFSFGALKELLMSGIWNSLDSLNSVLITGVDLFLTNLFVGNKEMGLFSLAKTISAAFSSMRSAITSVFVPEITIAYAKEDCDNTIAIVKKNMNIIAFIIVVPCAGLIAFGKQFCSLWLWYKEEQEIALVYMAMLLSLLPEIMYSLIGSLVSISTAANRIRARVLVNTLIGILGIFGSLVCLNVTDWGILAIAGCSSIFQVIITLIFIPMYSAHILNRKIYIFYGSIFRNTVGFILLLVLYFTIGKMIRLNNWISFIGTILVAGTIGYIISFFCILSKENRNVVLQKVNKCKR